MKRTQLLLSDLPEMCIASTAFRVLSPQTHYNCNSRSGYPKSKADSLCYVFTHTQAFTSTISWTRRTAVDLDRRGKFHRDLTTSCSTFI
jgi:hypothetical protein